MALDFSKIKTAIEKAFDDLTTLEVATLTNPAKVSIDLSAGNSGDIFTSIRQNLSQADLMAYTRFDLGGDEPGAHVFLFQATNHHSPERTKPGNRF
jgi:hypothetical protein